MFEHFLTDLLKIVIVLDVLGVVAYFLLGVLKPKSGVEPANPALSELASPPVPQAGKQLPPPPQMNNFLLKQENAPAPGPELTPRIGDWAKHSLECQNRRIL